MSFLPLTLHPVPHPVHLKLFSDLCFSLFLAALQCFMNFSVKIYSTFSFICLLPFSFTVNRQPLACATYLYIYGRPQVFPVEDLLGATQRKCRDENPCRRRTGSGRGLRPTAPFCAPDPRAAGHHRSIPNTVHPPCLRCPDPSISVCLIVPQITQKTMAEPSV